MGDVAALDEGYLPNRVYDLILKNVSKEDPLNEDEIQVRSFTKIAASNILA
jgi:hypothetical protein